MLDFVFNCTLWIKEHKVTSHAVFLCVFTYLDYSHYTAKTSSHLMELFFSLHFYMWFLSFRVFIAPILFSKSLVRSQRNYLDVLQTMKFAFSFFLHHIQSLQVVFILWFTWHIINPIVKSGYDWKQFLSHYNQQGDIGIEGLMHRTCKKQPQ